MHATRCLEFDPIATIRGVEAARKLGFLPDLPYERQSDEDIGRVRVLLAAAKYGAGPLSVPGVTPISGKLRPAPAEAPPL